MWPDCTVGSRKPLSFCLRVPFLWRPAGSKDWMSSFVILGGCRHELAILRGNSVPDPQVARKVGLRNSRMLLTREHWQFGAAQALALVTSGSD